MAEATEEAAEQAAEAEGQEAAAAAERATPTPAPVSASFEREISSIEMGNATNEKGQLVPVADMRLLHLFHRGLRHDLGVPLPKDDANLFAVHTGRRVRVTVELLPEDPPAPAQPQPARRGRR